MLRTKIRKLGGLICFLFAVLAVQAQQYMVTGGQGTPLMAKDETGEKLEVYLLYGMGNAAISYTSSSTNHKWYRYKSRALEAESVPCEQNGNTSTIRNVEEGYGYFVQESDILSRYVWIIDYSKYAFEVQNITVEGTCDNFLLKGSPEPARMQYNLPSGRTVELKREFEVSFQTLSWSDDNSFSLTPVTVTMEGNPYSGSIKEKGENKNVMPPLCDTEVTLKGDQFARHFGIEKSITSDTYQAVAVELHTDTTLIMDNAPNMTLGEGDLLCAPAEVTFRAYANEPVASLYTWRIYRSDVENGAENPLILYRGGEVDYTFAERGEYIAEVTVSDRTGECEAVSDPFVIKITESRLEIPNAFSPGTTPGINDEFRVAYQSLLNYKCSIFNRWGVEMYHSTNPAEGWDGKKGGKYVAPGVYFYVIEATGTAGEKFSRKGSINILRPKKINDEIIEQQ